MKVKKNAGGKTFVFNKNFDDAIKATRDFTILRTKVKTIEEFKDAMIEIFKNKNAKVSVDEEDSLEVDMEAEGKFVTIEFEPES